jgi:hypothetical protein
MKRDVMLPKFNLPGQRTWLMKGLWIAGGVVLIQVIVVGTLLLRQGVGKSETIASPPPPVAAAAPAPTPAPEVPAAPPAAVPNVPPPATRPAAPESESPRPTAANRGPGKPGMARFRGKGRRNGDRMFARTALGPRKAGAAAARGPRRNGPRRDVRNPGMRAGAPRPGKPDTIDQLLRNFK